MTGSNIGENIACIDIVNKEMKLIKHGFSMNDFEGDVELTETEILQINGKYYLVLGAAGPFHRIWDPKTYKYEVVYQFTTEDMKKPDYHRAHRLIHIKSQNKLYMFGGISIVLFGCIH